MSHIKITLSNGTEYPLNVDPNSYSEVDVVDFAPRAVAGTPAFSELGLYLDVAQDNFGHGFGKWIFSDPASYAYSGQSIDTRFEHAQLWTKIETIEAGLASSIKRLVVHRNIVLFVSLANGIYARNSANNDIITSWPAATASWVDLMSTGSYFFATQIGASARMQVGDAAQATSGGATTITLASAGWATNFWAGATVYIFDGVGAGQERTVSSNTGITLTVSSSWSTNPTNNSYFIVYKDAGSASNPPYGFRHLATFGGFYWGAEAFRPYLHFWANEDGSDAEGGQTTDPDVVKVGPVSFRTENVILNMIPFNNQLWVFRTDAAYVVGEDNLAYHTLNFADQVSSLNFQSVAVWNGFLVFNIKNTLYKYRSGLQDITPPHWDELPPYKQFGNFRSLFVRGPIIYCVAQSNVPNATDEPDTEAFTGFVSLLASDGVGWHKLMDLPNNTALASSTGFSAALDPVNDYIYMTVDGASSGDNWYRVKLQDLTELPYADYPTSGNHNLYTSYFDLGFKRIPKSLASLTLSGEFPTNTSVIVHFRTDDTTTWTSLGTFDSELEEITFPANTEAHRVQFRLNFQTSSAANTPAVRALIIKVMIRPDVLYGVNCDVLISDDISNPDQTINGLTAAEIRTGLKAARASVSPITFTDIYGVSASAYLTSVRFSVVQFEDDEHVQSVARSTFVFVTP